MSYIRDVKYYETDKMGIVHHSNYIRWFEEARMDFLEKLGFPYDKMEEMKIMSPVLAVSCTYKSVVKFGEKVTIHTKVTSFDGIKLVLAYEIEKQDHTRTTLGTSEHCFVDETFRPINMKKVNREFYEAINAVKQTQ
ncbi:acyl-CoA thioesterase [Anaerosporobacter faecicola]|uniref:acyl-CoA thioesterase n=1 Tax=Anaerosporobacter faecicola TaxID=2718714 RepID=UPI001439069B|nr:thioesterase family protein [Anaerosporobacter faecicola]